MMHMTSITECPSPMPAPPGATRWRTKVFLAGGITGCWDWQQEMIKALGDLPDDVLLMNPRRADFPTDLAAAEAAAEEQITWEFEHLTAADLIVFFFAAADSPQPIALYELGRYAALGQPLVVATEDGYPRTLDVRVQLALARPGIPVLRSLDQAAQAVTHYALTR